MPAHAEVRASWSKALAPAVFPVLLAAIGFAIGGIRAQSADETKWQQIEPDIQKIRAMPEPGQVVTQAQFVEVIKRLDEDVQHMRDDTQYLRQREEKRGR